MRWTEPVARVGEERKLYKFWVKKHEGKGPLGKLRHRWDDVLKMDLREFGWVCAVWIDLARDW
jgi:hypothetical protein